MLRQLRHCHLLDVVGDDEELGVCWVHGRYFVGKDQLRTGDRFERPSIVVVGVEVKISYVLGGDRSAGQEERAEQ